MDETITQKRKRPIEHGRRILAIYMILREAGQTYTADGWMSRDEEYSWLSTSQIENQLALRGHYPHSISTWISKTRTWVKATILGWTVSAARDEWKDGKRIAYYRLEKRN